MIFLDRPARESRLRSLMGDFVRNAAYVQWGLTAVGAAMLLVAGLSGLAHGRGPIVDGVATEPFTLPTNLVVAAALLLPAWFLAARRLGTWDRDAWAVMGRTKMALVILLVAPGILATVFLAPLMIVNSSSPCRR